MAFSHGPMLFIDDFFIAESSNVIRKINSPPREFAKPLLTGPEDKTCQPYMTVLRDEKTGRFRIWYNASDAKNSNLGHMESDDGIHWLRPHQTLGNVPHVNFGATVIDEAENFFGATVVDEGRKFSDPGSRFKFAVHFQKPGENRGLMLAHSADGLKWMANAEHAIVTNDFNDILTLIRDGARSRYLIVHGFPSHSEDGYTGHTQNSSEGYRRCVGQIESKDFVHWSKPHRIFAPDKKDEGITEFYSVGGIVPRGEMLVGLLKVLRDDLPCDDGGKVDGIGYTVLVWTHDGEHWERDREPFFDRDHTKNSWDHAMAWMDFQTLVGDDVYIYYGGYARGHKVERNTERQIGMVRMKRDRYVAREADARGGILRTKIFQFDANGISLNLDASQGEARVQIEDANGKPMRHFHFADCAPMKVDSVNAPANWKHSLSSLKGKPVRLAIELKNARLFAVNFSR